MAGWKVELLLVFNILEITHKALFTKVVKYQFKKQTNKK